MDLLNNLLPYWRFFCDNRFAHHTKGVFFESGNFAIRTKEGALTKYSPEGNVIERYNSAFALENECICEEFPEAILVHYDDTSYSIPCPKDSHATFFSNAVAITPRHSSTTKLYFITPEEKDLSCLTFDNALVAAVSLDGKVYLRRYPSYADNFLVDKTGKIILDVDADIDDIKFLFNGCFIVNFRSCYASGCGSILYDAENKELLQSERSHGICPCGDAVLFENKLLADFEGHFFAEYQEERAYYQGVSVFPHVLIEHHNGAKRFYPSDELWCVKRKYTGVLFCYKHAGRLYLAPRGLSYHQKIQFKELIHRYRDDTAFQRYLKRLEEII